MGPSKPLMGLVYLELLTPRIRVRREVYSLPGSHGIPNPYRTGMLMTVFITAHH
jgi:hypothetical protein